MFKFETHKKDLYNTLLFLSRNIFFYEKLKLSDTFETRIYLIFFHFSIMMIIYKNKGKKFDQSMYDDLFNNIENNLRELGLGDVTVNKKMKELNRILYDILLKIDISNKGQNIFKIDHKLIIKYFTDLVDEKSSKYMLFRNYFNNFFQFCFELPLENMVRDAIKYKV